MKRINATSETSKQALNLVTSMQSFFAEKLENLSLSFEKKRNLKLLSGLGIRATMKRPKIGR